MRRSALNHNWLQNGYMVFLLALLEYGADGFVDFEFERELLHNLQEWERHQGDFKVLVESINQMSPREAVGNELAFYLPVADREWLSEVSHECWVYRLKIRQLTDDVTRYLAASNERYAALVAGVISDRSEPKNWAAHAGVAESFHFACNELSEAISRLPSNVEVG